MHDCVYEGCMDWPEKRTLEKKKTDKIRLTKKQGRSARKNCGSPVLLSAGYGNTGRLIPSDTAGSPITKPAFRLLKRTLTDKSSISFTNSTFSICNAAFQLTILHLGLLFSLFSGDSAAKCQLSWRYDNNRKQNVKNTWHSVGCNVSWFHEGSTEGKPAARRSGKILQITISYRRRKTWTFSDLPDLSSRSEEHTSELQSR